MPISHEDLFELAESLANSDDECHLRSAASRGYYGLFHFCSLLADNCLPELIYVENNSHEKVIKRFIEFEDTDNPENQREIRRIGLCLRFAKNIRVKADYRLNEDFLRARVQEIFSNKKAIEEAVPKTNLSLPS